MMRFLFFAVLFTAIYTNCYGQDTLYYIEDLNLKDVRVQGPTVANVYDVITEYKEGLLLSTRYDMNKDYKKREAIVLIEDSATKEGYCVMYDSTGKKTEDGYYSMGQKHGEWKEYYDSGNVHAKVPYKEDTVSGKLLSYYETGELKREEQLLGYVSLGGKCYDKIGKEIPFTPYYQMPDFPNEKKDVNYFIAKELRYPKIAVQYGIEGRVIVQFVVEKDGRISRPKVVRPVHETLDAEAIRVVTRMPNWIPGKIDDEPVPVYFTLPITFRLE
jgi:protein TonB